jgi:transposase-like protein
MARKITPGARQAQEIAELLDGQSEAPSGEELWSALIRLSTERVLQDTLEQEQTEALGRGRYERQETPQGSRHGYEEGAVKTAEGVVRWQLPPVRGLREPYRSKLWAALGRTSDVLTTLIVERYAGGMAQRDLASALEEALGQFVLSKSAVSALTDRRPHEEEAFRTRARSGSDLASLFMDAVYEP